jgi:hypothetical protein
MQYLQYCYLLFVCTVQTVVGVTTRSVPYILQNTNTLPTARGTAADSISTSNNNYFGYCRFVILSAQYRLSLHAAISNFPLCVGQRVLLRSTAGNITFRLTVLTLGSLRPADMHRTSRRRCAGESEDATP